MNPTLFPLCDLLAKSLIVLTLALIAGRALRAHSAASRHLLWLGLLIALIGLPFTRTISPRWCFSWEKKPEPIPAMTFPIVSTVPIEFSTATPPPIEATPAIPVQPRKAIPWSSVIFAIWGVGFGFVILHRLTGSLILHRLRRDSALLEDERIHPLVGQICAEQNIHSRIEVRISSRTCVPLTWGIKRHVLLLPVEMIEWPVHRLQAAIRHEVAHIARHDYFTRLISTLVCAVVLAEPVDLGCSTRIA